MPETKGEFGYFQGDSIVSPPKSSGESITTQIEVKSKRLFASKVKRKTAEDTNKEMLKIYTPLSSIAKGILLDNGVEFYKHYELIDKLGIQTYFAHPYCSSERGCNERHNGLLRRFIPKGTDLKNISQEELDEIVSFWNKMPRKILEYKTPLEVWNKEIANSS